MDLPLPKISGSFIRPTIPVTAVFIHLIAARRPVCSAAHPTSALQTRIE